jgi:hypothetical protein
LLAIKYGIRVKVYPFSQVYVPGLAIYLNIEWQMPMAENVIIVVAAFFYVAAIRYKPFAFAFKYFVLYGIANAAALRPFRGNTNT